jgi:hypothetical protein
MTVDCGGLLLWRAHVCMPPRRCDPINTPHPARDAGSNERRDEGRNAIEGGAARMAQLLEEHNAENFSGAPESCLLNQAEKQ